MVVGDWGRKGDDGQQEVADCMEKVSKLLDAEFVFATGDNFYPDGVASTQDSNWEDSFEDIYTGFNLNIPWHMILGNHDYRGNPQAQVDYTWKSQRWNMPNRYFNIDYLLDDDDPELGQLSFVFMDTSPFEDKYYSEDKYNKVWVQDSTRQLAWMDSVMKSKATADWLIVTGHHPLYLGGKRKEET